jgi:CRISPR-associated protein Csc1
MVRIYQCQLTLHDNVFFATREMGTLYETEKYLHNWALSFALFENSYLRKPYRTEGEYAQKPRYLDAPDRPDVPTLLHLNSAGIYVFPAQPIVWSYQINTFKAAQVSYYGKPDRFGEGDAKRNYPANIGRAKELVVGSVFKTYIISNDEITLPKWIRLGKWAAKIHLDVKLIPETSIIAKSGEYSCKHPLNPMDLTSSSRLLLYDVIVMPPSSLVSQSRLSGNYWEIDAQNSIIHLPKEVGYGNSVCTT